MDIIQRWFPKAKIMIDPFHIIQAISRELNKYRTQFMNSVRTKDERLYNKFKQYWKLILMKPEKLQSFTYHPFKLFDWLTNTQGIVDYLLDKEEMLKDTYYVVHGLGQAYRMKNWELFETTLQQASQRKLFSGLKRVLRTLKKYKDYIHNSFTYYRPYKWIVRRY